MKRFGFFRAYAHTRWGKYRCVLLVIRHDDGSPDTPRNKWSLYWLPKDNLGGRQLGVLTPWFHAGIGE